MKYSLKGLLILFLFTVACGANSITLLNVSYDPTREFYDAYNKLFIPLWKQKTDEDVEIQQSHGGSGAQARAVIEGLRADVVTLALAHDIDLIVEKTHLIPANWQSRFPNNSCPYTSTIVFLVRQGNPKMIHDWPDLIRKNVQVITANPKTSGGARWNYLAAFGYAFKKSGGNEQEAINFVKSLYQHVPVLDTGARGSTNTFAQRGVGDVLIAWENEAYLVLTKFGADKFQVVRPSISILTEPPVAVVLQNTNKKGTTPAANAYLNTLYSPAAQELIAKFYLRPSNPMIAAKYVRLFPKMTLMTIQDLGGWQTAQTKHFAQGGIFDQIYQKDE